MFCVKVCSNMQFFVRVVWDSSSHAALLAQFGSNFWFQCLRYSRLSFFGVQSSLGTECGYVPLVLWTALWTLMRFGTGTNFTGVLRY